MAFCWPLDNPSFSFCCSVENEQELLDQQQMLKRKEVRPLSGPVSPLFSSTWCCHPLIPQLLCLLFFCLFPFSCPKDPPLPLLLLSCFPSSSVSRSRINLVHSLLGRFIRDLDRRRESLVSAQFSSILPSMPPLEKILQLSEFYSWEM